MVRRSKEKRVQRSRDRSDLSKGLAQDLPGQRADEAVALGEPDEVGGKVHAKFRVARAGQDFEAHHHAGAQLHQRLKERDHFIVVKGVRQRFQGGFHSYLGKETFRGPMY
jgi:hypothetical protein